MCGNTNKRLIKNCLFHIWFLIKFWLNLLMDNHHFLTSFVDDGNFDYIKNIYLKMVLGYIHLYTSIICFLVPIVNLSFVNCQIVNQ